MQEAGVTWSDFWGKQISHRARKSAQSAGLLKSIIILLFTCIGSLSYCSPADSLTIRLKQENSQLQTRLKCADSIIKYENYRLSENLASTEKILNNRFDDLLKLAGTIITLIVFVISASWINANRSAKKAAEDLFEKNFNKYRQRLKKMEADAQELLEKIEAHENSANAMRDHLYEMTEQEDGKTKEVVSKVLSDILQKLNEAK